MCVVVRVYVCRVRVYVCVVVRVYVCVVARVYVCVVVRVYVCMEQTHGPEYVKNERSLIACLLQTIVY